MTTHLVCAACGAVMREGRPDCSLCGSSMAGTWPWDGRAVPRRPSQNLARAEQQAAFLQSLVLTLTWVAAGAAVAGAAFGALAGAYVAAGFSLVTLALAIFGATQAWQARGDEGAEAVQMARAAATGLVGMSHAAGSPGTVRRLGMMAWSVNLVVAVVFLGASNRAFFSLAGAGMVLVALITMSVRNSNLYRLAQGVSSFGVPR